MGSCEICGDDLRRCSQGHVSGAGELFCDTCGELLPFAADQHEVTPAAPVALDYSSGSFSDFIAGGEEDLGGTSGPWPDVAVAVADPPELEMAPAQADFVPEPRAAEPGDYAAFEPEPKAEPEPEAGQEAGAEPGPLSEPEALLEPEALPEPEPP